MTSRLKHWADFAAAAPELAAYGAARFASRVAYLATLRPDGAPRVHPFTPLLLEERMFCFMRATSPKGRDLRRDGRVAVHCSVENEEGGGGEFYVAGETRVVEDSQLRARVSTGAGYDVGADDVLFEFLLSHARSIVYGDQSSSSMEWRAS